MKQQQQQKRVGYFDSFFKIGLYFKRLKKETKIS